MNFVSVPQTVQMSSFSSSVSSSSSSSNSKKRNKNKKNKAAVNNDFLDPRLREEREKWRGEILEEMDARIDAKLKEEREILKEERENMDAKLKEEWENMRAELLEMQTNVNKIMRVVMQMIIPTQAIMRRELVDWERNKVLADADITITDGTNVHQLLIDNKAAITTTMGIKESVWKVLLEGNEWRQRCRSPSFDC